MLANRVSGRGVVKILNRCPNTNASSSVGLEIKVEEIFRLANWSAPNMTSRRKATGSVGHLSHYISMVIIKGDDMTFGT